MNRAIGGHSSAFLISKHALTMMCVTFATVASAFLMAMPAFDPTGVNRYHTGTVLSVLWCVGLLAWALRAVRSHQSRFSIATVAGITAVVAVGFVNVFPAMAIVCLAMVLDLGVVGKTESWKGVTWRSIQVVAGITGLAHAFRIMYHLLMN